MLDHILGRDEVDDVVEEMSTSITYYLQWMAEPHKNFFK